MEEENELRSFSIEECITEQEHSDRKSLMELSRKMGFQ